VECIVRSLRPFLLILPLALVMLWPGTAASADKKNILILNSYHQGYKWTDEQLLGILESIAPDRNSCSFFIEFMGTKWIHGPIYSATLRSLYTTKYRKTPFDLIIATDNDAFEFLLLFRDDLFGEVPVVFCGINWLDPARVAHHRGFTGVNEDADIAATLDLMLALHPGTKTIHVVIDHTTTGRIVEDQLNELLPRYRGKVEIEILPEMPVQDLISRVASLSSGSLVLLTVYQQDRTGSYVEFFEVPGEMSSRSRVPIYGLWDFHLGYGIVGGMLTSGYAQGQAAGRIARRVLEGEPAASIPLVMQSPNRLRFDFEQLQRFSIRPEVLPPGSDIVNHPPSFYTVNKKLIWGLSFGFAAMFVTVVVLLINIRRRSIAETALRASEQRYHTLVDNLTLGVYRCSPDAAGRFIHVNPAMAAMFGYPSMEAMMLSSISELYPDPRNREPLLAELRRSGQLTKREILMRRQDGTEIWIAANAKAHHDHAGTIGWIDGTFEDITERKKLEAQLRQTQKIEAMGILTGGISHDFNNILTAIIGYANLLQMRVDKDSTNRNYVDEILRSSQRAAALTKSLLAFSRRQEMEVRPLDINECIRQFRAFLSRIIGEDIELKTALAEDNPILLADRGQIEQVLMNLATNARDAMEHGGVLSIGTRSVDLEGSEIPALATLPPGHYVEIAVSDTGCGMDEATRIRIFEPFFTTKEAGMGTGLGLSILHGIVKQHNGEIIVYSEIGRGTTFKVYLPATTATGEEEPGPPTQPRGGNETILLIEDDTALRHLERGILEQFGYHVIEAADGEEGLRLYYEVNGKVDCLLLDVIMPKKNGREVYEEIRRLRPDIKALFTSGYTTDVIRRHGLLEEHFDFLPKPATPAEMLRKLREVLDSNSRDTSSAPGDSG
jgi:PAS domain S-box-containing protein